MSDSGSSARSGSGSQRSSRRSGSYSGSRSSARSGSARSPSPGQSSGRSGSSRSPSPSDQLISGSSRSAASAAERSSRRSSRRSASSRSPSPASSPRSSRRSGSPARSAGSSRRSGSPARSARSAGSARSGSSARSGGSARSGSARSGSARSGSARSGSARSSSPAPLGGTSGVKRGVMAPNPEDEDSSVVSDESTDPEVDLIDLGSESEVYPDADFGSPMKTYFASLPQAPPRSNPWEIVDPFLARLQDNILTLGEHVRKIQAQEIAVIEKFQEKLESFNAAAQPAEMIEQQKIRHDFNIKIQAIREARKEYRAMLFDAITERNNMLRSGEIEKEIAVENLRRLELVHPRKAFDWYLFAFFFVQLALVILYLIFVDYPDLDEVVPPPNDPVVGILGSSVRADNFYTYWIWISFSVFIGFGFLWSMPWKAMWTAVGLTLLGGSFAFQISLLLNGAFKLVDLRDFQKFALAPTQLMEGAYAAGAIVISYGAFVGFVDPMAMTLGVFIETIIYCLNYWLGAGEVGAVDPGRGIFTLTFGALFGLAVSVAFTLSMPFQRSTADATGPTAKLDLVRKAAALTTGNYFSTLTSTMGLFFVFATMPAWNQQTSQYWNLDKYNTALLDSGLGTSQYRSVQNTAIGAAAGAVTTFFLAFLFRVGKFRLSEVQQGALAGAIAMCSAHSVIIRPWGAIILAVLSASISMLLARFFQRMVLLRWLRVLDSRNVLTTVLVPATMAVVASIVSIGIYVEGDINVYGQSMKDLFDQSGQVWRQIVAWGITICLSIGGGAGVGALLAGVHWFNKASTTDWMKDSTFWAIVGAQ